MTELLTERSARIVAARKLTRRAGRDAAGLFLAEGRQAVAEALADPAGVREVFATEAAAAAHADLLARRRRSRSGSSPRRPRPGCPRRSPRRGWSPSARCATSRRRRRRAARRGSSVALAELADPGNAGTVLRTADAVRCRRGGVRRGLGRPVRRQGGAGQRGQPVPRRRRPRCAAAGRCSPALQAAGVTVLAADGGGEAALDELTTELAGPVLWLFGNEARGVPAELAALADARVRIPMRGRAESLNLAAAAAICLYTTQLAQR